MVLMGGLRLFVGLAFLGVVIALCVWLLSRLFPETSKLPQSSQQDTAQASRQAQQTIDVKKHKLHEVSEVMQDHVSRNNSTSSDERLL